MTSRAKRPRDPFQLAKQIGDIATGQAVEADPDAGKNPSAVERGRKGGQQGGKSRMAILNPSAIVAHGNRQR